MFVKNIIKRTLFNEFTKDLLISNKKKFIFAYFSYRFQCVIIFLCPQIIFNFMRKIMIILCYLKIFTSFC
jgi:hypothetical protein